MNFNKEHDVYGILTRTDSSTEKYYYKMRDQLNGTIFKKTSYVCNRYSLDSNNLFDCFYKHRGVFYRNILLEYSPVNKRDILDSLHRTYLRINNKNGSYKDLVLFEDNDLIYLYLRDSFGVNDFHKMEVLDKNEIHDFSTELYLHSYLKRLGCIDLDVRSLLRVIKLMIHSNQLNIKLSQIVIDYCIGLDNKCLDILEYLYGID